MTQDTTVQTMLAPDVGALVDYGLNSFGTGPGQYRVTGWIRAAPKPTFEPGDVFGEILFEGCQEIDTGDGRGAKRMQSCLREEATHVSLTGIGGAIAPIDKCKVVGRVS